MVQVVERHWYDKNKHIFPASRWEVSSEGVGEGLRAAWRLEVSDFWRTGSLGAGLAWAGLANECK